MRVCLDARLVGFAGIGAFIEGLWGGLVAQDVDALALASSRADKQWRGATVSLPGRSFASTMKPFGVAEQVGLPIVLQRHGIDVFHSPHLTVPYLSRIPVVLTIHDVFPLKPASNARSAAARWYYQLAWPAAVRRAAVVVTNSSYSAGEVQRYLRVPDRKLHVIEHGLDHERWHRPPQSQIEKKLAEMVITPPYLLYVGTTKPHKNLATILRAHGSDMPPLIVAGPTEEELASVTPRRSDGSVVRALGRVPTSDLPSLYAGAEALLLPSLYEGVGFTALEAMACGTPVIASSGEGLVDTVGDAGVLVAPTDVDAWTEAITGVIGSSQLSKRLIEAGLARVRQRSWTACARAYELVYRIAAN